MATTQAIHRPALGVQNASIGTLYDIRTDRFLTAALDVDPSAISWEDMKNNNLEYISGDSYREKLRSLSVGPGLGASILAGFVELEGSAGFISHKQACSGHVEQSLIYSITTVSEEWTPSRVKAISSSLSRTSDIKDGTHIVTQVIWGSQSILTAKKTMSLEDDPQTIARHLLDQLKLWKPLAGKHRNKKRNWATDPELVTEIELFSDFVLPGGSSVTQLSDAFAFLDHLPSYIKLTDEGKGYQLAYTLMPISCLFPSAESHGPASYIVNKSESICFGKVLQLFDAIQSLGQSLRAYHSLLENNNDLVSENHMRDIGDKISTANNVRAEVSGAFSHTLKKLRAGGFDQQTMQSFFDLIDRQTHEVSQISFPLLHTHKNKIGFVKSMVARGAKYIGFNSESLNRELNRNPGVDIYVFHFSEEAMSCSNEDIWRQCVELLDQFSDDGSGTTRMILHDFDALGARLEKPVLELMRDSQVVIENVLSEIDNGSQTFSIRHDLDHLEAGYPRSIRAIAMKIPCPCLPVIPREWTCTRCETQVDYGFTDDYLYCDCGRCLYEFWDFQCSNHRHGSKFLDHDNVQMRKLLKSLKRPEEVNILILGQTGVGKSTWINAFVNYLTHTTLDDALAADKLSWVIPFAFSMHQTGADGTYSKIKTSFGFDQISKKSPATTQQAVTGENDGTTGESATQIATVHRVHIKNLVVRLIDTPGIGDTRGVNQDKKNMADILTLLRTYDKLHGVLILMKPNEQRLGILFRFCLQELLAHLHRDAARNIAFGFTNTRGTSYKPGDTFDVLQAYLDKVKDIDIRLQVSNVYCFDSESFRYLAAQKQHKLPAEHLEEIRKSWEQSVGESKRLIDHFKQIKPHEVKSTVNLYETRHSIIRMTEPMAAIAERIKSTIMVNEDDIRDLSQKTLKKKELEQKLKVRVNTLITKGVDRPRTACAHHDCVGYSNTGLVGADGKPTLSTVYETLCHNPCYLRSIEVDKVGYNGLQHCAAMQRSPTGSCSVCNHPWSIHLHIKYEYEDTVVETDDPAVIAALQRNATDRETKEAAIASKRRLIQELEQELIVVRDAMAHFSMFLKVNAIVPINDATLEYLDFQINQERGKISAGGSRDKFDRLSDIRKQYEEEVIILKGYMEKGEKHKLLGKEDAQDLVKKLYSLKHSGKQLRQAREILETTVVNVHREQRHVMKPNLQRGWTVPGAGLFKKMKRTLSSMVPWGKAQMGHAEASAVSE